MASLSTLASGSSGNACIIHSAATHILLDAGISCRRIAEGLRADGCSLEQLSAILITHSHSDHVSGLATLLRRSAAPIYASLPTANTLVKTLPELMPRLRVFYPGEGFAVNDILVQSLPTSHDAAGSVAYRLDGEDFSFAAMTDTGIIPEGAEGLFFGVHTLLLEANHDPVMLENGPYPYYLKRRIAGELGHLANATAARFARGAEAAGTKQIILAHLSRENNTPQRAAEVVADALSGTASLSVAERDVRMGFILSEGASRLCRE